MKYILVSLFMLLILVGELTKKEKKVDPVKTEILKVYKLTKVDAG